VVTPSKLEKIIVNEGSGSFGKIFYQYDSKGLLSSDSSYYCYPDMNSCDLVSKSKHQYDTEGRLLKENYFSGANLDAYLDFQYNSDKLSQIVYGGINSPRKAEFFYDVNGNPDYAIDSWVGLSTAKHYIKYEVGDDFLRVLTYYYKPDNTLTNLILKQEFKFDKFKKPVPLEEYGCLYLWAKKEKNNVIWARSTFYDQSTGLATDVCEVANTYSYNADGFPATLVSQSVNECSDVGNFDPGALVTFFYKQ
jgi:hypothetical protein